MCIKIYTENGWERDLNRSMARWCFLSPVEKSGRGMPTRGAAREMLFSAAARALRRLDIYGKLDPKRKDLPSTLKIKR
jgi:hypothetical protein